MQGKSHITSYLHVLRMRYATPSVNLDLEGMLECKLTAKKTAVGKSYSSGDF